jgi:hypothetical protein
MEQTMRVKMPTMTDPQDPKDAPHSHNGGGSGFIPYVSAWESLPDAIKRVTAGGRPKDRAQTDLCQAIADGLVKIRGKLKRHTPSHMTSKAVLEGKDFQIPPDLKPADLDERSCPRNPWVVRRESFSPSGYWYLEWIKVCRADVTNVFCSAGKQDETTRHASSEAPATNTRRPALESRVPIGPGPSSIAGPRKLGAAGPARRRGARPLKFEQTRDAMRNDIQRGRHTVADLEDMLEKNLVTNYDVSRDTARKARKAVLSELDSRQIPTNDK